MMKVWKRSFVLAVCFLGAIAPLVKAAECMILESRACVDSLDSFYSTGFSRTKFKVRCDGKEGWVPWNVQINSVELLYSGFNGPRASVRKQKLTLGKPSPIDFVSSIYHFYHSGMKEPSLSLRQIGYFLTGAGGRLSDAEVPSEYQFKRREHDVAIRPDSLDIDDNTKLYHDCHLKEEKGTIANVKAQKREVDSKLVCNYINSGGLGLGGASENPVLIYQNDHNSSMLGSRPVVPETTPMCFGNVRCYYGSEDESIVTKMRVVCSANRRANALRKNEVGSWECPSAIQCVVDRSVAISTHHHRNVEILSTETQASPPSSSSSTTGR